MVFRLLEADPAKRITAKEMLTHPWIHASLFETDSSKMLASISSPTPKFSAKKQQQLKCSLNSMIDKSYEKLIEEDENQN